METENPPYGLVNLGAYGTNHMVDHNGSSTSDHIGPFYHCIPPREYNNQSSNYAGYDLSTSPSTDFGNIWNTAPLYSAQPSVYSNSPLTETSDIFGTVESRREYTATCAVDSGLERGTAPKEKPARRQPRRSSTRKQATQGDTDTKEVIEAAIKGSTRGGTKKTTKAKAARTKAKPGPKSRSKAKQASQKEMEVMEVEGQEPSQDNSTVSPRQVMSDSMTRKIQERNRVASNKFRVKKREDAKQLKIDESNMKETNRDLSGCVADLTMEVYNLKMRLLQHTDCNCHLIQEYIATEAQRYIKDLGEEGAERRQSVPIWYGG